MTVQSEKSAVLDTSELVMAELGKMFSSYNDYSKAVILEKYGMVLNSSGNMVVNDHAGWNSLLATMGVPNADEVMTRRQYGHGKSHQKYIDTQAKIVATLRIQIILADRVGDTKKANFLRTLDSGVFASIDEADRKEVQDRAMTRMIPLMTKALSQEGIPWVVTGEEKQ